jgi:hypothetical protein
MNDEEFSDEPRFSRAEFDYKQMLLIHLRNISKLTTTVLFPSAQQPVFPTEMVKILENMLDERFIKAVHFFQMLLSPYYDKTFNKDLNELIELNKEKRIDEDTFTMRLVGILIQLMDRRNLLLESEDKDKT